MKNQEIAKILYEMAELLEMQEVQFKPRAFEKAAHSIEAMEEPVEDIYKKEGIRGLEDISGIGTGIAGRIEEFLRTGRVGDYEKLKKKIPVNIGELTAIEGVGPKMVLRLYKELKIKNIKDLEKAAKSGKIRLLKDFGEKTEKNILDGIEFLKKSGGRFVLGFVMPLLREIETRLKNLKEVKQISLAGSVRRMKETVGDGDILIISKNPKPVMDFFVKMPEVIHVYSHGETKSAVKLNNGMDLDLRVVPEESFGSALQYFTGNKDHNIVLRKIAIDKGYKLNEYGVYRNIKYQKSKILKNKNAWAKIAGRTEQEVYGALGLKYIEPELRENIGEIEAVRKNKLPKLIGYKDLKGDLQIQTNWTDGENSVEEYAREAQKLGLEYIAITDHTKSLAMTGGSDEKKLLKQMRAIDKINSKFKIPIFAPPTLMLRRASKASAGRQNSKFKILKGAEVNIMKDGSLDIEDEVLAKLDIVGAAVHSHFNLPKDRQTKRIIKAMENPNVDILFHPTGRIINRRKAYDVDIDEIIKTAKKTGTVLEIDAFPDRLDLKDEYARKAVEAGVKLVIDSDAHSINHLHYLEFGVATARRGWARKSDVVNTKPLKEFLKMLKH